MRWFATRRRKLTVLFLLMLALVGVTSQVEASDGMRGDRCVVANDVYIEEDFYFFCRVLEVRGTIDGDLIGAASEITIYRTAVVTGDLWVGGGKLVVEGRIGDDMHFLGITSTVGEHARFATNRVDLLSVAINTEISSDAVLPGDLLVYGYQVRVAGTVGGDIDFGGESLTIEGVVAGRVDAEVGDIRRDTDLPSLPFYDISLSDPGLHFGPDAYIGSDLAYRSRTAILPPPDTVSGSIHFEQIGRQPDITRVERARDAAEILVNYIRVSVREMITLLFIGTFGLLVVPNLIRQPALHVRRRIVPTVGWGLVTFMLSIPTVIVVVVLGLIVVLIMYLIRLNELTILIGVGLLIVTSGLVGTFAFLLIYAGRVIVSYAIGQLLDRYVLRSVQLVGFRRWVVMMALGTAIYTLIVNIPIPAMGLTIELITALAGVGAVVMHFRSAIYESRQMIAQATEPAIATTVAVTAPPIAKEIDTGPGMSNLPEGFTGFEEDW